MAADAKAASCKIKNNSASQKETKNQNALPKIDDPGVIFLLEREFFTHWNKKYLWYFLNDFVEITDHRCCIIFGPPCIYTHTRVKESLPA